MPTDSDKALARLDYRIGSFSVRYSRAEAILTSLVARALLSGTLVTPKVRRAYKEQVATILQGVDAQGLPEALRLVDDAYQLGVRIAAERSMGRLDKQAVTLLRDNLNERLGDATTHVGRRVDDIFRKEALRMSAMQLGPGETPNPGVSLQRALTKQGVTAFKDKAGRNWGLEEYATMAVKTTTSEAVFLGTQNTLLGKNLDVVKVNSVPNPCPSCAAYDGGTFSLTGRSDHPLLDVVFPIHPACRHYITAAKEAFEERRALA